MMHESDRDDRDALLDSVVEALRRPVPIRPNLEAQVMTIIRAQRRRRKGFIWAGLALAAGLAGVALLARSQGTSAKAQPVEFALDAPAASRVALVGDFNNWDPAATILTRHNGHWFTVLPLAPGRYQFNFIVDGNRWVSDPRWPAATDDGFGTPASVITVVPSARL